jgi:TPR repeat protein
MTMTYMRIASALFLLLVAIGCRRNERQPTGSIAALLHSKDRVAVYDAGVDAYQRKEYGMARELWRHAAELGDHNAASNLGFLLYYGLGGVADSAKAVAYWRTAMAQGDAEAHRHVAQAIQDGDVRLGSEAEA